MFLSMPIAFRDRRHVTLFREAVADPARLSLVPDNSEGLQCN
jgi:hypothetical protein